MPQDPVLPLFSGTETGRRSPFTSLPAGSILSGLPTKAGPVLLGAYLWLSSRANGTLQRDGTEHLYQWLDRSSFSNNATQTAPAQQPLVQTDGVAGHAVSFED